MKRSGIRLQYNAPVTLTFFFLSLASLILGYLTNNWTTSHLFSVYRSSMTDPLFYVRLFGHVLGHGGWNHFINNMLLFLVIAPGMSANPTITGNLLIHTFHCRLKSHSWKRFWDYDTFVV